MGAIIGVRVVAQRRRAIGHLMLEEPRHGTPRQRRSDPPVQPGAHGGHRAAEEQRHAPALGQPGGAGHVPGRGGVLEGLDLQPGGLEPDAGTAVQDGDQAGVALLETLAQQFGKEMVVAMPAPLVV